MSIRNINLNRGGLQIAIEIVIYEGHGYSIKVSYGAMMYILSEYDSEANIEIGHAVQPIAPYGSCARALIGITDSFN